MADKGSADSAPARSRKPKVHVPHIDESGIARSGASGITHPGQGISAQIDREMAAMRAEWEARRQDMRTVRPDAPKQPDVEPRADDTESRDLRVTEAMVAVERRYAPRYLNCRMRIRRIESLLAEANGPARDSLLCKLELARADLAAVDAACTSAKELARLDAGPAIGEKDDGGNSSKQNTVSDAVSSEGTADADRYPDQKAGGGPD